MAELILTEEEKAAKTWLELPDETIGKLTKKLACDISDVADELTRVEMAAAICLIVGRLDEIGSTGLSTKLKPFTRNNQDRGHWSLELRETQAAPKK